mgnify:CR=1 FL=1
MSDIEFVDGMIIKAPRENSPHFVKGSISIKRKDLGNWLRGKTDEWINLDIKESKNGKWYVAVNDWKPEQQSTQPAPANYDEDVPF